MVKAEFVPLIGVSLIMELHQELKSLLGQNRELVSSLMTTLPEKPSDKDERHISDLRQLLSHYLMHLRSVSEEPGLNTIIMTGYLNLTLKLLGQLEECLRSLPLTSRNREHLRVNSAKLNVMVSSWESAAYGIPMDDLLAQPRDHERWRRLSEFTEIRASLDPGALRGFIEDMYKSVIWAHAFVSKGLKYTNSTMRMVMTGFYVFYYSMSPMKAYHEARLNFAQPSLESILSLTRTENSLIARMFEKSPFKIQCNEVIHLSRDFTGFAFKPGEATIPVRVISSFPLPQMKGTDRRLFRFCSTSRMEVAAVRPNKVILHVHGGGFISMSSRSHLPYLQKWALDTNAVIFSVDYRLAPEHPYPAGLDDVWQVYQWLLTLAKTQLEIDPQKLVLAGDSAGGHLAIGCVIRAIQAGIRVPDGLVLPYPALCMDPDLYSPSLTLSLDDMCLNYTFMKSCQAAYLQDPTLDPRTDPLLSPVRAPLDLLAMFPPTRLLIGTLDPLMDDTLRFAERLLDARVDMRLAIFEGHVHGGMNYMIKIESEDAKALALRASSFLCELLGDRM